MRDRETVNDITARTSTPAHAELQQAIRQCIDLIGHLADLCESPGAPTAHANGAYSAQESTRLLGQILRAHYQDLHNSDMQVLIARLAPEA
jgi:hypothetical protein